MESRPPAARARATGSEARWRGDVCARLRPPTSLRIPVLPSACHPNGPPVFPKPSVSPRTQIKTQTSLHSFTLVPAVALFFVATSVASALVVTTISAIPACSHRCRCSSLVGLACVRLLIGVTRGGIRVLRRLSLYK